MVDISHLKVHPFICMCNGHFGHECVESVPRNIFIVIDKFLVAQWEPPGCVTVQEK